MKISLKRDPVCGMDVDPSHAGDETQYGGQTFYFCSRDCKDRFESAPARYANVVPGATLSHPSHPTTPQSIEGHSNAQRGRGLRKTRIPSGHQTRHF